jgi:hypothetical protein
MASPIALTDTFGQWVEKFNQLNADFNDVIVAGDNAGFAYDSVGTTGLNAAFTSGKVRDGSLVETVPEQTVTLAPSQVQIVAVFKQTGSAPTLEVYPSGSLPEKYVIPLAVFETDATSIIGVNDLRTMFIASAGSGDGASNGMLIMDKLISSSVTIATGRGAVSIDPIVDDGVTVTVADGATWVVL